MCDLYSQLAENLLGEDELQTQKRMASEANERRLKFVEREAEEAQDHGRDLTEDAIDSTYSEYITVLLH